MNASDCVTGFSLNSSKPNLKCVLVNGHSLRQKVFEFDQNIVEKYKADIILVTETWLSSEIPDNIFLCRKNYDVIRHDRIIGKGGGAVALVKKKLKASVKPWPFAHGEGVWFEIAKPEKITFALFYNNDVTNVQAMRSLLDSIETHIEHISTPLIVCGDLNQPGIDWISLSASTSHDQDLHLDRFLATGLHQKVTFPTFPRSGNTLDLVFENIDGLISDIFQGDELFSDHNTVRFDVATQITANHGSKEVFDYSKIDVTNAKRFLDCQTWRQLLQVSENISIDSIWYNFASFYENFCSTFIPKKKVPFTDQKPKYPKFLRKLHNKVSAARRKLSAAFSLERSIKFQERLLAFKNALQQYVSTQEMRIVQSENRNAFFKFVRSRIGKCRTSPNIVDPTTNEPIADAKLKADCFNAYFKSVYIDDANDNPDGPPIVPEDNDNTADFIVSSTMVYKQLMHLSSHSSPGNDMIHPIVLKTFAAEFSVPLAIIFNLTLQRSQLPSDWLAAIVTPVYKGKGNSCSCCNYRPISLTSHCCKMMERIIKAWLLQHCRAHNIISSKQHGFLSGRSTLTNLLSCLGEWTAALDDGDYVDVVYLDIAKAFDTVSHKKLLTKLVNAEFPPVLLRWIKSFLANRNQRVKIEDILSESVNVTSGVPQGSVLGPFLFVIFINELPSIPQHTKIQIYADDTKLYFRFRRNETSQALQQDLTSVVNWLNEWGLSVAAEKCFVLPLSLTGKRDTFNFEINDQKIPVIHDSVRDLGVHFSSNIKVSSHISFVRSKANSVTGMIFRCFKSRNTQFLVQLYTVYVRPLVEYNSACWNPYQLSDIVAVESVQRTFTRRIPEVSHLSYPDRLQKLGLESLEQRRVTTDIVELFKIITNRSIIKPAEFIIFEPPTNRRRKHNKIIAERRWKTTFGQNSFYGRTPKIWNDLKPETVNSKSVLCFKRCLESENIGKWLQCFPQHYL